MAIAARNGDSNVHGVIVHADRGSPVHEQRLPRLLPGPAPPAPALGRTHRSVLGQRGGRVVLGVASSANASRAACSPPAPRPVERSSVGSTGTTRPGCTAPSTASHPSSGNSSTVKRHNHPSARRGDVPVRVACSRSARGNSGRYVRVRNWLSLNGLSLLLSGRLWLLVTPRRNATGLAGHRRASVGVDGELVPCDFDVTAMAYPTPRCSRAAGPSRVAHSVRVMHPPPRAASLRSVRNQWGDPARRPRRAGAPALRRFGRSAGDLCGSSIRR